MDEAWIRAHVNPVGPIEVAHARPWATVLRVPLADRTVWFKACAPVQAFEPRLSGELFARNGLRPGDEWFTRLRDAYLEPWGTGLVEAFGLAIRTGKFAHVIASTRQRDALPAEARPVFDEEFGWVLRRAIAQTLDSLTSDAARTDRARPCSLPKGPGGGDRNPRRSKHSGDGPAAGAWALGWEVLTLFDRLGRRPHALAE